MLEMTPVTKARSRIVSPHHDPVSTHVTGQVPPSRLIKKHRTSLIYTFSKAARDIVCLLPSSFASPSLSSTYITDLPILGVSLVCFGLLAYIFTAVRPSLVSNWALYQGYVPVLVVFFLAVFLMGKFLFHSAARGVGLSLWLTLMLFLKFQDFVLTPVLIIVTGTVLIGASYIWTMLFSR